MNKKTGFSMGGTIEKTRNIKAIKSNCFKCYHKKFYKNNPNVAYCDFYKIDYPNKKHCKRFHQLETLSRSEKEQIKNINNLRKIFKSNKYQCINCKYSKSLMFCFKTSKNIIPSDKLCTCKYFSKL